MLVTKIDRMEVFVPSTVTIQEVRFWIELDSAIQHIENSLNTPEAGIFMMQN